MLFHRYLEALFGSKAKVGVLRALWRHSGKEFTIRELASFLGLSHAGVGKALADLEKVNVVVMKTIGRSYTVRLNAGSYAAHIVEDIFKLEEGTLDELKRTLNEGLDVPEVISVAIFGSVARGRETSSSDVDLLIVTNHREKVEETVSRLQGEVTSRFGNTLMPYYLSEEEFELKKDTLLMKQIIKNHIIVCGLVGSNGV